MKAAKKGENPNDSYFEEVESESNAPQDPYTLDNRRGYESSSTAHKVESKTAQRLKKKVEQIQKEELVKGELDEVVDPNYIDPEREETLALFTQNKKKLKEQGHLLHRNDYN